MKTAIALGNFDGVHIAHKKLIENAVSYADDRGLKSLVYIFETHPRVVLGDSDFKVITDNKTKERTIMSLGADEVYYESTTRQMLSMKPEEFISRVIVARFHAEYVTAGYNYRFGDGGAGDASDLIVFGEKYGFKTEIVDKITYGGQDISSSLLRNLIVNGKIEKANSLMYKPYTICGKVAEGKKLGRRLGVSTANVRLPKELLMPKKGVYRTKTLIGGREYNSITNIGTNPTVEHIEPRSETHIMDFSGDLYGKYIEISFYEFIRPEEKFDTLEALTAQIGKDISYVKKIVDKNK